MTTFFAFLALYAGIRLISGQAARDELDMQKRNDPYYHSNH
jgi:hypothetical protein